jgi:Tol biopolymer transport system component
MVVSGDRYVNEYFSAPSPSGDTLAFTARGFVTSQWWRKGHSHLDESEIWLRREGAPAKYEPLTGDGEKAAWPMWAADGRSLFYVSDRSGAENIWARSLQAGARTAAERQLTRFTDGRVLWPSIAHDGRLIAFERDFRMWTFDTTTNTAQVVRLTRRGTPASEPVEHIAFSDRFQELSVSADGRKLAIVARGEIFAAATADGGVAVRITRTPAREFQPVWSPDSRKLASVSSRNRTWAIYLYDFTTQTEQLVTEGSRPLFSPDGKQLAFIRTHEDRTDLHVVDLATGQPRRLAKIFNSTPAPPFPAGGDGPGLARFSWSPNGQWIAYPSWDRQEIVNVHVANVASGDSHQVSFLGHGNGGATEWTPDGTALIIATQQRTDAAVVARVDLILRTPQFREDEFRRLFNDPPARPPQPKESRTASDDTPPGSGPAPFVFEGIRERLRVIPWVLTPPRTRSPPMEKHCCSSLEQPVSRTCTPTRWTSSRRSDRLRARSPQPPVQRHSCTSRRMAVICTSWNRGARDLPRGLVVS